MLLGKDILAQGQKPNIILILADDLGYGDVSCYGQQKIRTPNIDRLAASGMRFTQFYSGSTVCAPARSSFMTGLHTGHTAVRGNVTLSPEGQFPLPDSVITIAMLLQRNGYSTAAFGKWSLGFITSSGDPQKKGFDEFYGYNCQTLAHNYYPDHLWHNHERIELPGNKLDSVYSADLIHKQAMNFLNKKHEQPFFLYLPYTLPHADVVVPHDAVYNYYVEKFNEAPVPAPRSPGGDGEKHHYDPNPHAAFAAMVSRLDRFVGELMASLQKNHLDKNTLVIFTSDNGPHREAGGDPEFFRGNGGFSGIKRDLYEGGIREPFIAVMPGKIKAGSVNETPCILYDLCPTFLDLCGIHQQARVDGVSILPLFQNKKMPQRSYFYWELHEAGGKQAIRMGNWKGIKRNVSKEANARMELYDLASDPQEKNNVADQHPDVVSKMEQYMKEAHVPDKHWPLLTTEK